MNRLHFASLAALFLAAGAARAGGHYGADFEIRSKLGPDWCMDARGDKQVNGDIVFLYKCHGHENQRWAITHDGNGQSAIVGTGGLCLDVSGHRKDAGAPVQLWACHFQGNQRFKQEGELIKEVESGKCLAVESKGKPPADGNRIGLAACDPKDDHQQWSYTHSAK